MTRRKMLVIAVALVLVAVVLSAVFIELIRPEQESLYQQDMLYQVSAFNWFSAGNFEGNTTFAELAKYGDFGIGTITGLDGEMIALNGQFYQIPAEGTPRLIDPSERTPYATITFFNIDQTFQVANISSYSQLAAEINATLPTLNTIYAIKVHGFFDFANTRSPQLQTEPYPTLTDALKNQALFTLNGVEGTLVGFFFPDYMNGVDYAGYHLHFLTDDHTAGGHLLDCAIKNATVEIDQINNYHLFIS